MNTSAAVGAAVISPSLVRAAQTSSGRTFDVIGYFPEWRMGRFDLSTTEGLLTETVAFSVEPAADGSIDMRRLPDDRLTKLREETKRLGQRMTVSLGGWGRCEHYAAVAADAGLRAKHVAACLELCRRAGLDGLDIDWEHPQTPAELNNCAALFAETRAAFEPEGFILTSALPDWVNIPRHGYEALNRVNLMSYDHEARHATPEQAERDVQRLLDRGVKPDAIALGVPFYGRPIDRSNGQSGGSYAQIVERYNPEPGQDEVNGIYYNSPETIAAKTRFAIERGLAGIMIWEITEDLSGPKSLLRAINEAASA